ncbi:MAG: FkbM family methyltransferase [Pirellulales bacterium]|nr:FkbM family methyltransferase [Pirellulales bacterium]
MKFKHLTSKFRELRLHPGYRRNRAVVLWRVAVWSAHCLLGLPARAKFRRWKFRLYLPPKWRGGGCTSPYLFREDYEPEVKLLERFLQPGMTFIDGGANTGVFTLTAAHLVGPTGHVVAFEPGATCFAALDQSIRLNCVNHVNLRQQAISDRCGRARFYHHHEQENSFSLGGASEVMYEEVSTTTLDTTFEELKLDRVDCVKLDVEGAEELVFRGGQKLLAQYRPLLLFEVNPEAAERLSLAANGGCTALTELNYRLFRMDQNGRLRSAASADEFGNVLAIPAERLGELGIESSMTHRQTIAL